MELSSILTEEEMSGISPEVAAKIESACAAEVRAAGGTDKQRKQVDQMLEAVSAKAEKMIAEAVAENVSKMKSDAINDHMYKVLCAVSACLESANIPVTLNNSTSEESKRLAEQLAEVNKKLKSVYAEREDLKDKLNEAEKKSYIMRLVQGLKPDVAQAVIEHFMKYDVRDIDSDSVMKFIDSSSNDLYMMDVDPERDGKLNMDNVMNALKDIDTELDRETKLDSVGCLDDMKNIDYEFGGENPFAPVKKPKTTPKLEALGKGLKPQRVAVATPNMVCEATDSIAPLGMDDAADVATAMDQMQAFADLGICNFSQKFA